MSIKIYPEQETQWSFLDCQTCYHESTKPRTKDDPKHIFTLCEFCSAAMKKLRLCECCGKVVDLFHYTRIRLGDGTIEVVRCPKGEK